MGQTAKTRIISEENKNSEKLKVFFEDSFERSAVIKSYSFMLLKPKAGLKMKA